MSQNSIILKSKSELERILKSVRNSLAKMSRLTFWRSHFAKHKFHFNKKFNWETFTQIPFSTKEDISSLAIDKRLFDATKLFKKNPFGVVLMSTSGTTTQKKPTLLVRDTHIDKEGAGEVVKENNRTLIFFQPRTLSLCILCSVFEKTERKVKNNQILFVNPYGFKATMIEAICQMKSSFILSFPSHITYLNFTFPEIKQIFSTSKKLWVSGDFLSEKQASFIVSLYPNLEINPDYMTGELGLVGRGCKFLRKKHGNNAYHPSDSGILELTNIDPEGIGEIAVTKLNPFEAGYIRYRTGDLAKIIEKPCPCGNLWTFYLVGRGNMDYIKSLGTLISRTEIERALRNISNLIEEWRGEVREIKFKGIFIGELKLILKPYANIPKRQLDIGRLSDIISTNLRLTPKKTLVELAKEEKFMPLQIELVNQFPETMKKVPLRKVLD